ncbi:MAG: glycosyltransferase, partial [Lachnospiraceae bacterium]|nr:glycosyltransferase [Lachnospiraceae bacterium]
NLKHFPRIGHEVLMGTGRRYIKRGISYLKRNGLVNTFNKGVERIKTDREQKGYVPYHASDAEVEEQRNTRCADPKKFSVLVPVYETDPVLFEKMLESVADQTYGNWELILADASRDDSRRNAVRNFTEERNLLCKDEYGTLFDKIRYFKIPDNKGISHNTNEALDRASGDYICLLDHDDILEKTALFDIMASVENTKALVIYTDEDKINEDGTRYFDINKKPDFDPVLLRTNNYICHFLAVDINLAKSVGGFRSEYDGAQDHDFILRCTEGLPREQILHIPKVLYHWRSTADSTAENPDAKLYAYEAGKRAVTDHLKRIGIEAKVTDSPDLGFFRIGYERYHRPVMRIKTEELDPAKLDSEFVMVLSSSLMPLNNEYIADMMGCMRRSNVGAVTGKIIGRDKKVESAGFDIDDNGNMVPMFAGLGRHFSGYMHRANLDRLVRGYSNDCVLLRREAVTTSGSWIRLKEGYDIYYTPKAVFSRRGV